MKKASGLASAALVVLALGLIGPSSALAVTATLYWTAPGDDGMIGTAARYDMRYSLVPITTTTWNTATRVNLVQNPSPPGTLENVSVGGLVGDVTYYFAIRTADERGNWSAISNVCVYVQKVAGTETPTYTLALAPPRPNPSRDRAAFALTLAKDGPVVAEILDPAGRLVRCLAREQRQAGPNDLSWDLRGDDGSRTAPGVYWVRVQAGGRILTRQLVVMR